MSYAQDARDASNRLLIGDSCRVIRSHTSFINKAVVEMVSSLPTSSAIEDINNVETTLREALVAAVNAKAKIKGE